jgi:hypothetical protein
MGIAAAESFPMPSTFAMEFAVTAEAVFMPIPIAPVKTRPAPVEPAAAVVTMEPRTSADKYASDKVIGTVVAVWRASVGGIPIVAVRADWRDVNVSRPAINRRNSNSNSEPNLRVGCSRHNHAKPEQNSVF